MTLELSFKTYNTTTMDNKIKKASMWKMAHNNKLQHPQYLKWLNPTKYGVQNMVTVTRFENCPVTRLR